jgi:hypothetical protein
MRRRLPNWVDSNYAKETHTKGRKKRGGGNNKTKQQHKRATMQGDMIMNLV